MIKSLFLILGMVSSFSNHGSSMEKQTTVNMFGLFKQQDPVENFWKWFQANEKELRDFQKDPDKVLNQVLIQAKKIKAGLAIEFEPPQNNIINITISADGDKSLFPTVKRIVDKAPKIAGWNIIAFRQRIPTEQIKTMILKTEDYELDPGKMKFFPVVSGEKLDVIIYTYRVTESNYNQIAYTGLLLLDNILGEYDCVTKVRNYDFQNMPASPEELKDLKPLLDLSAYVDSFYKAKKH